MLQLIDDIYFMVQWLQSLYFSFKIQENHPQYNMQCRIHLISYSSWIRSSPKKPLLVWSSISPSTKKASFCSPEVFDILNKLMKSDEDNATGDVQLLCKLFSGERCSYHYSTEETQIIPSNTSFSILSSTQLLNAAKLIAKMDKWPWSYR